MEKGLRTGGQSDSQHVSLRGQEVEEGKSLTLHKVRKSFDKRSIGENSIQLLENLREKLGFMSRCGNHVVVSAESQQLLITISDSVFHYLYIVSFFKPSRIVIPI